MTATRLRPLACIGYPNDSGDGAVIRLRGRIGHAPIDVVVDAHPVARAFVIVEVAKAAPARRLTAAVVVGDEVSLVVFRILTSPNPAHFRYIRARRAACQRSATARAKESIKRAIAPILARDIGRLSRWFTLSMCASTAPVKGQHRDRGRTNHDLSKPREEAAPPKRLSRFPADRLGALVKDLSDTREWLNGHELCLSTVLMIKRDCERRQDIFGSRQRRDRWR